MDYGSMARSTLWDRATNLGLSPGGGGNMEDDDIGEIFTVLVLSTKYDQFVTLVNSRRVP